MKIKKSIKIFLCAFLICSLIGLQVNREKPKADVLTLTATAAELTFGVAALPYILGGIAVVAGGVVIYKAGQAIYNRYYLHKIDEAIKQMDSTTKAKYDKMAQDYAAVPSGGTYTLNANDITACMTPCLAELEAEDTWQDYQNSTNVESVSTAIPQDVINISNNTLNKIKTDFANVQYQISYHAFRYIPCINKGYEVLMEQSSPVDALSVPDVYAWCGDVNIHVYNPSNGKSFTLDALQEIDLPTSAYSGNTIYDYRDRLFSPTYTFTVGYKPLTADVLSTATTQLEQALGKSINCDISKYFDIAGEGSICYYPPTIASGTKSVDMPDSLAIPGSIGSTNPDCYVSIPTVSTPSSTVSVPTTPSGTGDTGTDTTSLWQSLLNFLQKILDAILSIPALIQSILNWLQSIPSLIANAFQSLFSGLQSVLQNILDFLKSIPSAISTVFDGTLAVDDVLGLQNKFKIDKLTGAWDAIKNMDTSRGIAPVIYINLNNIFYAATKRFVNYHSPFKDGNTVFIDCADWNKYTFGGIGVVDYFRGIMGAGMIITTLYYVYRKIIPSKAVS